MSMPLNKPAIPTVLRNLAKNLVLWRPEQKKSRMAAVMEHQKLGKKYSKVSRIAFIGSLSWNTSFEHSDVDIAHRLRSRTMPPETAEKFREFLIHKNVTTPETSQIVNVGSFPALRYIMKDPAIEEQLSFCVRFHGHQVCIERSNWVRDEIRSDSNVWTMIVLMKKWLLETGLGTVVGGGLDSYGLALGVVGFVKNWYDRQPPERRKGHKKYEQPDLYQLFLDYLTFWIEWDYKRNALDPTTGDIIPRGRTRLPNFVSQHYLSIIDPCVPLHDATATCKHTPELVTALEELRSALQHPELSGDDLSYAICKPRRVLPREEGSGAWKGRKVVPFMEESVEKARGGLRIHRICDGLTGWGKSGRGPRDWKDGLKLWQEEQDRKMAERERKRAERERKSSGRDWDLDEYLDEETMERRRKLAEIMNKFK